MGALCRRAVRCCPQAPYMQRVATCGASRRQRRDAMARIDRVEEPLSSLPSPAAPVAWLPQVGPFEIRPPLPADHSAYCAFAARLEREDLRLRFAGLVKLDCEALRAQLLAIDHTQHEALAVFAGGEMLAIAHLVRTA